LTCCTSETRPAGAERRGRGVAERAGVDRAGVERGVVERAGVERGVVARGGVASGGVERLEEAWSGGGSVGASERARASLGAGPLVRCAEGRRERRKSGRVSGSGGKRGFLGMGGELLAAIRKAMAVASTVDRCRLEARRETPREKLP
jgi:hypothetical protein